MLIVDARSYTAAIANRAKGGGCEYTAYYPNCDIEFMNLPNIHAIRSSFNAIRSLSSSIDSARLARGRSSSSYGLFSCVIISTPVVKLLGHMLHVHSFSASYSLAWNAVDRSVLILHFMARLVLVLSQD